MILLMSSCAFAQVGSTRWADTVWPVALCLSYLTDRSLGLWACFTSVLTAICLQLAAWVSALGAHSITPIEQRGSKRGASACHHFRR